MASIFTATAPAVTVTTSPLLLLAANRGAKYRAVMLPVAGTLWVGTLGVTTTGAGFPVTLAQPFIMSGGDDGSSVYQGALYGVTTAICTPSIVELSS